MRDFAPILGVSRQFISKVENGKKQPSISLIKKLETATKLSVWALAKGDFDIQNQKNYLKIADQNFYDVSIKTASVKN